MLWTCPKCQTQNSESSMYCQNCGERKGGEKLTAKSKTSSSSISSNSSNIKYFQNAEQRFSRILNKPNFKTLETYAAISLILGFLCYVGAIILFFVSLKDGTGFLGSLIVAITPILTGFSLHLISEIISLFLQGQEEWYLSSKYTYVNAELTEELIKRIDNLESRITKLSYNDSESEE